MAANSDTLLRYLRRLVMRDEAGEGTDAALLGRFIADRDDRAFAALVDRHAALVLRVCWRILGNPHDAQDAFQATFLVLARKAATVRPRDLLPAWLHGVARRVALKARAVRDRQRLAGPPLVPPVDPHPDPLADLSARELLAIVDEEVGRLAEVYRLPVILCCLEGRSQEEAARQLGWTPGSVKGRLERGRARLHERLVRRGLTLSGALAAAEVSRGVASAAWVARLVGPTTQGALAFASGTSPAAGGVSAAAVASARALLHGMALGRLAMAAAVALATCLVTAGWLLHQPAPDNPSSPPSPAGRKAPVAPAAMANNIRGPIPDEFDPRTEVGGRVLDPQGRPLAGARLYVGYAPRRSEPGATAHTPPYPLRATSDTDGRFHFAFTRAELDARFLDASRPVVVAVADGYGLDWAELGGPDRNAALDLRLVEDLPLEGRILGPDRQPVAGARVLVLDVSGLAAAGTSGDQKRCHGPLPGQPRVMTDDDGRFRLAGVGRGRLVTLAVEGPTFARAVVQAETRPRAEVPAGLTRGVPFEYTAVTSRSLRGVVRDKATGEPLAGVTVSLPSAGCTARTDRDGRYELTGCPRSGPYVVTAQPSGQAYLAAAARPSDVPGLAPLVVDFELVRGIPLRGRVTDRTTGKPPKKALVEYYALFPNPHSAALTRLGRQQPASSSPVGPDGSYGLTVLPGPGVVLVVASPRDSYASALLDDEELAALFHDSKDHGGGSWIHVAAGGSEWRRCVDRYNALTLINPGEQVKSLALDVKVQRAQPLRGTVVGPEGKPLAGVEVSGLTSMPDAERLATASFTVEGLNPRRTRRLSFLHRDKDLGRVVTLRGDETEALTVRLEPCGAVVGRVVNKAGKAVPGVEVFFSRSDKGLEAKATTDHLGRFRVALVPGLNYRPTVGSVPCLPADVPDIEVEPGQTKDIGDVPSGN